MGYPTFNGFDLQDDNYITSEIEYRTSPSRSLDYERLSRRPGVKLFSSDFAERKVSIKGYVIANGATDLRSKIDALHKNVTRPDKGTLIIDGERWGTAILTSVGIADPHYTQDFVPFEIELLMTDPFWYGSQQTVVLPVTSGTTTLTTSITISGSVFAEPQIVYRAPDGTGSTTTSGIIVEYAPSGEKLTWSGTSSPTLAYGSSLTFDYINQRITEDSTVADIDGVFARWEPEALSFQTTFSGTALGGQLEFIYNPRYL
jgi:hypothetical protein